MENIFVRPAMKSDLPVLLEFEQGVVAAERPFDVTLAPDPILYYDLEAMISAPDVALLVAEAAGQVVGSGYARIEEAKPYLRHPNYAYLGFMFVPPAFRGKGINKLIIDALFAWSASRGITEIRLDVYNGNEPAIRAYQKVGFLPHMLEMRRSG